MILRGSVPIPAGDPERISRNRHRPVFQPVVQYREPLESLGNSVEPRCIFGARVWPPGVAKRRHTSPIPLSLSFGIHLSSFPSFSSLNEKEESTYPRIRMLASVLSGGRDLRFFCQPSRVSPLVLPDATFSLSARRVTYASHLLVYLVSLSLTLHRP